MKKRCWTCEIKIFLAKLIVRIFGLKDIEKEIMERFKKKE